MFAVVLAAGSATRFGRTKQLEFIEGTTLVARAVSTARDVCGPRNVLVTGHDSSDVVAAAGDGMGFFVVNERFEEGMGSSIAAGVSAVSHVADAILLMLADQPLITADHLNAMVGAWGGPDDIVTTSFADTQGPPVLFPRSAFPRLRELSGDTGARSVVEDWQFSVKTIQFDDAAVDIDTAGDLTRLNLD